MSDTVSNDCLSLATDSAVMRSYIAFKKISASVRCGDIQCETAVDALVPSEKHQQLEVLKPLAASQVVHFLVKGIPHSSFEKCSKKEVL